MIYPFSAVVGQERCKNALLWNLVNPRIGGVLLSGEKGTAKSTLVRAVAALTDKQVVEIPLNITEERLLGGVDFEEAIRTGKKTVEPGLLARADGQLLYVDEINLLSDAAAHSVLEAAGEGQVRLEREGVSSVYPSRFVLVGSMNPEEGGLRPQLLDRFGLFVQAKGEESPLLRAEIVRRRLAFEDDPRAFARRWAGEEEKLRQRIQSAARRMEQVEISPSAVMLAAQLAEGAHCQGSRGELALMETARAIAAWYGSGTVNKEALLEAAKYALPHRMQEPTPEERPAPPPPPEQAPPQEAETPPERAESRSEVEDTPSDVPPRREKEESEAPEQTEGIGEVFDVGRWLTENCRRTIRQGSGRRSVVKTTALQGRYVRAAIRPDSQDLALDATLRAAAPYQKNREKHGLAVAITRDDLRAKVREKRTGHLIVFVVDASGSMGANRRMRAVKGAILSLLSDAYQKRDRVAMITFRKDKAQLVLGVTRSVELAARQLASLATGGKTPLYAGLEAAHDLVCAQRRREKDVLPVVVLVSDGRATAGRGRDAFGDAVAAGQALAADKIKTIIVDVEQDFVKLGLAHKLGEAMGAEVVTLPQLHAGALVSAVHRAVHG